TSPSTPTPQASSSMLRPRPSTTLFPYTTLFRSNILHKEMPAYNPYMMRHEIQTRRSLARSALTLGAVSLAAILIMSYPLFQQEAVAHVDLEVTNTRIKVECTIGSYHGPCIIDTGMPMGFFVNKNATRGYPKPLLLIKYYGMTGHSGWGKVISLPITIGDKTVEISGVLVDHKLEAPFIGLATL